MTGMKKNMKTLSCMLHHAGTIVVKYGGSIMKNPAAITAFIEDVAALRQAGARIVIVHGGGPGITRFLDRMGIASSFVKGLRVTDKESVEIVEMVLSGQVNKDLAYKLSKAGVKAVGISGRDNNLIEAEKMYLQDNGEKLDIGFVGEVVHINEAIISDLLEMGYVPVISPIACDKDGHTYNINADYAAAAIAAALEASYLVYLSDVEGLYTDIHDENSFVPAITVEEIVKLIREGVITGGMIPKMDCCIKAIQNGTKNVCLIDGRKNNSLSGFFNGDQSGTLIKGGNYHDESTYSKYVCKV